MISSGATPNFHNSAIARTGVRVPAMIGAPWRISSVQTTYGCCVAVVMLVVILRDRSMRAAYERKHEKSI